MGTVDPTFPLIPVAGFTAAALLLPVLFFSLTRERWNLGVIFLCFWLICENLVFAINAILWAESADTKLYVYCQIASHVRVAADIAKPMSTLVMMRRLSSITSFPSPPLDLSKAKRRRELFIEWLLGFISPVVVAGPLYIGLQGPRLDILEGFGCSGPTPRTIVCFLIIYPWYIIPAVISVTVYYPKLAMIFYRQGTAVDHFLRSNETKVSRITYFRILALASIDLILTLPINITSMVMLMLPMIQEKHTPFFLNWVTDPDRNAPVIHTWTDLHSSAAPGLGLVEVYFVRWTTALLSVFVFAILGLTKGARKSYGQAMDTTMGWFGHHRAPEQVVPHPASPIMMFSVPDMTTVSDLAGLCQSQMQDNGEESVQYEGGFAFARPYKAHVSGSGPSPASD